MNLSMSNCLTEADGYDASWHTFYAKCLDAFRQTMDGVHWKSREIESSETTANLTFICMSDTHLNACV